LHIAAVNDRVEIAQFLINRGAKVNALDRWRRTPLQEAVSNKSKKTAKVLAQHSASLCLSGMDLAVFLNKIVMQGDLYMLRLALLSGTSSVNCADYDDRTPLHVAGDLGFQTIFDFLISKGGADINKRDRWGAIP
jgi:ankyrin repeat protein